MIGQTGAEGIKTEEERKLFGGLMDAAYDTCYHKQCDDVYVLLSFDWLC